MATMPGVTPTGPEVLDGLRIKRSSTAEQVADAVRGMIMRGELKPGTPLREVPMAASIGISRNTMREAIRVLAREGLVTHHMHHGALVTRLREADVVDIFRVRRTLELRAIEASGGAAELDGLRAPVDEIERAAQVGDWERIVEADRLFHEHLVGLLGSRRLDRFFETIQAELWLCLSIVDRANDDPAELVDEHRELYDLMAAGERNRCVARMAEHLADAQQRLTDIVRNWEGQ